MCLKVGFHSWRALFYPSHPYSQWSIIRWARKNRIQGSIRFMLRSWRYYVRRWWLNNWNKTLNNWCHMGKIRCVRSCSDWSWMGMCKTCMLIDGVESRCCWRLHDSCFAIILWPLVSTHVYKIDRNMNNSPWPLLHHKRSQRKWIACPSRCLINVCITRIIIILIFNFKELATFCKLKINLWKTIFLPTHTS